MNQFRTKKDVINWAEGHLPSAYMSMARTFREGSIEFLGGFRHVAENNPGWIIKLRNLKYGKTYYLFITIKNLKPVLRVINGHHVKWEYWQGDESDNPLYQGDNPKKYKELKNAKEKEVL